MKHAFFDKLLKPRQRGPKKRPRPRCIRHGGGKFVGGVPLGVLKIEIKLSTTEACLQGGPPYFVKKVELLNFYQ